MDVRNWPMGQIMQLPDCCFGRRWPVLTSRGIATDVTDQWLVGQPIPDRCVLWGLHIVLGGSISTDSFFKLAFSDHEPADAADFNTFERVFRGDFDNAADEGAFYLEYGAELQIPMKVLLEPQGRRFAVQAFNGHESATKYFRAAFVISSIPKEVPDWLISGNLRSL